MDQELFTLFQQGFSYFAIGTIAASLFFVMAGLRDLSNEKMEGFLYLMLGVFFLAAHAYYLFGASDLLELRTAFTVNFIWLWTINILAPAVITLFGLLGLFNMMSDNFGIGALKLFCGGAMALLLFVLGATWAMDVRGITTAFGSMIWFSFEMRTPTA